MIKYKPRNHLMAAIIIHTNKICKFKLTWNMVNVSITPIPLTIRCIPHCGKSFRYLCLTFFCPFK